MRDLNLHSKPITGSCLCGELEYRITGEITDGCYCHCAICRKLSGSAFAAYGAVKTSDLVWIKGENAIATFSPTPDTTRGFCANCHSFVFSKHVLEPENTFISLGTLDNTDSVQILYHQFTGHRVPWCDLEDKLKKYGEWPVASSTPKRK